MCLDIRHDAVEGSCHTGGIQLVARRRQLVLGYQQTTLDLGNMPHTLGHTIHLIGVVSLRDDYLLHLEAGLLYLTLMLLYGILLPP